MLNKELRAIGREPWPIRAFDLIWAQVQDELIERDERLEERQGDKLTLARAGRRATLLTERARMIRQAINCGKRHSYKIDEEGTAVHEDRVKLARAFAQDPTRNKLSIGVGSGPHIGVQKGPL